MTVFVATYISATTAVNGDVSQSIVTTDIVGPVVVQSPDSSSNRIALGVGLGVGIPTLAVTAFAAYWTWKSIIKRRSGLL